MPDNTNDGRPVMLSQEMIRKAIQDVNFYTQLPEFTDVKTKVVQANEQLKSATGCSGCQKRKVVNNLFGEFMRILKTCNTETLQRLKAYYKIDKLMLNARNTKTGAIELLIV